MKLRIVTATRGESPYWAETVASVAALKATAEHVVVCPAEKQAQVGGEGRAFTLVAQHRPGLYPKINQALREPGEWDAFTWINDDDVLRAPGFGRLAEWMQANPETDIGYGRVDLIDGRSGQVGDLPTARNPDDLGALFARGVIPFAQPGTIIRRRAYEQLGGIDESYRIVGDMDFFVRAVAAGVRFGFVDEHVASFRLNAGQLSKRTDEVAAETARALRPLQDRAARFGALARFRLANLGVYADRIRRHGFVSMRELYDRTQ
jgi:hypothetical protein